MLLIFGLNLGSGAPTPAPTPAPGGTMPAKTVNSSATPYATAADMLLRFDANLVGQLVRDDGTQASAAELLSDPVLANVLARGSAEAEAVLTRSSRYTPGDLHALSGTIAAERLKDICCVLAFEDLRLRRGYLEDRLHPLCLKVAQDLKDFSEGLDIFPFAEVEAAGLPDIEAMIPADFWADIPTLLTNNARAWGVRADRRGYPGAF